MKYEPIKNKISSAVRSNVFLRKILYSVLNLFLLRAWHVKRSLRKAFKDTRFASALDAGCGMGEFSYYIFRKFDAEVLGVDILGEEVIRNSNFASRIASNRLSFIQADISAKDLPNLLNRKFDLILSVDVMEHIKDDVAVFRNFADLLNNNGVVIISTPSGSDSEIDNGHKSFVDEHYRDGYSINSLKKKLQSANLRVLSTSYTYGWAGSVYWNLSIKIPMTILNKSDLFFVIIPFYLIITFPISLIFMAIDYFFPPSSGGGLLVVATRSSETI
ncbi:MAG: class I SAM-dependent methyltransferase [Candidatus Kryptoniota bacterium]